MLGSSSDHEHSFAAAKKAKRTLLSSSKLPRDKESNRLFLSDAGPTPQDFDVLRPMLAPFLILRYWPKVAIKQYLRLQAFLFAERGGNNFDDFGDTLLCDAEFNKLKRTILMLQKNVAEEGAVLIWDVLAEIPELELRSIDDVVEIIHLPSDMPMDYYCHEGFWMPQVWFIFLIFVGKMHIKATFRGMCALDTKADLKRLSLISEKGGWCDKETILGHGINQWWLGKRPSEYPASAPQRLPLANIMFVKAKVLKTSCPGDVKQKKVTTSLLYVTINHNHRTVFKKELSVFFIRGSTHVLALRAVVVNRESIFCLGLPPLPKVNTLTLALPEDRTPESFKEQLKKTCLWFFKFDDFDFLPDFTSTFEAYCQVKLHQPALVGVNQSFGCMVQGKPTIDFFYFIDLVYSAEELLFLSKDGAIAEQDGEEEELDEVTATKAKKTKGVCRKAALLVIGQRLISRFQQWECFGGVVCKPVDGTPLYFKEAPCDELFRNAMEDNFSISITGVLEYKASHDE